MRRRTGQSGSVIKKRGYWIGRYYLDQSNGEDRTRPSITLGRITEMSKSEAKRSLRASLEKLGINNVPTSNSPVGKTFSERYQWWEVNKLALKKEGYRDKVSMMVNTHILPYFENTPVDFISEEKVQEFITHLSRQKYQTRDGVLHALSAEYVHDIVALLRRIVGKVSEDWELTLPEIPYKEQRYFTADEMLQIINAAKGHWKPFFALLSETGLRFGEAAGLHVEDLNLLARKITVRRSIYRGQEVSPKTRKGYREVNINPELCHMLEQHLKSRTSGYIFQTRNSTPLSNQNSRRMLQTILKRLKIRKGGLHSFRHGRVSILQAAGVPAELIKQWVGHSNLRTTSKYTHFDDGFAQSEAMRVGLLNLIRPHRPHFEQKLEDGQHSQSAAA